MLDDIVYHHTLVILAYPINLLVVNEIQSEILQPKRLILFTGLQLQII